MIVSSVGRAIWDRVHREKLHPCYASECFRLSKFCLESAGRQCVDGCRAMSLTEALGQVHSSIGAMDNFNRGIMRKHFPDLMELVAKYADHDYMLDNYKGDSK